MKYKAILETSGETYESSGESLDEAMGALNLEWHQIKAKGVLTVTLGKDSRKQLFNMRLLRRIFANKLTLQLWAKRLELLLKDAHDNL